MGRLWLRVIAPAATLFGVVCCSSGPSSSDPTAAQPSETVRSTAPGGEDTFGAPVAVGDLIVTLSDPKVESDASGPWLTITARAENQSTAGAQPPTFELRCAGSGAGGSWLATSTFKQTETIEGGAAEEGTISLLLPGDDRSGRARPSCAAPATVVASVLSVGATGQPSHEQGEWVVPSGLVEQLNVG